MGIFRRLPDPIPLRRMTRFVGTPTRRDPPSDLQAHVGALIDELTDASGHDARVPIRNELRGLGGPAAEVLAEHLDHPDCFTRWEVVSLLGELAEPETLEIVVEFALTEEEVHARWRSFWAVTRFAARRTIPLLLEALDAGDSARRWRAALILSMLRQEAAGPVLVEGLKSTERWVQWEALSALKSLRFRGAEKKIAAFLEPTQPRELRQEAVLALGAIGSASGQMLLQDALCDPEPEVRWRASMSLARSGDPRWIPKLRERLDRESDAQVCDQLTNDIAHLEARHGQI